MFKWLDATAAKALGHSLAQIVGNRMPGDSQEIGAGKLSKKTQAMLFQMEKQIKAFKAKEQLNIYTKAQFANTFKWSLRDKGFDSSYIDTLTAWILQRC